MEAIRIGNVYNDEKFTGGNFAGNVYESEGLCPSIMTMQGGGREPMTVEVKKEMSFLGNIYGKNDGYDGSVYHPSGISKPIMSGHGISTWVIEERIVKRVEPWVWEVDGVKYRIRIRKLTPKECFRLMGFTDEDFEKAKYKTETIYLTGGDKCNVKLKPAKEKPKQTDMENYVLCTTKGSHDMDHLKRELGIFMNVPSSECEVSASIVTGKSEKLDHLGRATSITKCIEYMGMHFTMTEGNDQRHTVIAARGKEDRQNTGKCMRIITESNLSRDKLFIILTLFERIIESKIFTSSTVQANIHGVMRITEDRGDSILMQITNLEMDVTTEEMSNSSLYRQTGNSIVVDVLEAIFRQMI